MHSQTFGPRLLLNRFGVYLGLTLHRWLGVGSVGVICVATKDIWPAFMSGALLGVLGGLHRASEESDAQMLEATERGLLVRNGDGESTLVSWDNVGAIQSSRSYGSWGWPRVRVHVFQGGQARIFRIWQEGYKDELETFIQRCAEFREGACHSVPRALLASVFESQLVFPIVKRAVFDGAIAATIGGFLTRSVLVAVVAFVVNPVVSALLSISRLPFRRRCYEWNGTSWTCQCGVEVRLLKKLPRSLRLWLQLQREIDLREGA